MTGDDPAGLMATRDPAAAPAEPQPRGRVPLGWTIALMVAAAVALHLGLPRLAGFDNTWRRLSSGEPLWLCAAALLEVASYAAYVFTFHRLFARPASRIGWRESYDISLTGVAASRVFSAAGAGGIALTVWALDRSGMHGRPLVSRLTTFYAVLYGIFMAALVVVGVGLRTGVLDGPAPFGLTVVPAIFGALPGIWLLAADHPGCSPISGCAAP